MYALLSVMEDCFLLALHNFLVLDILTGVRWNLWVLLNCISLMTKDLEHLFKCFLAISGSSVENSLLRFVSHFLNGLFGLLMSSFEFFIYFCYQPSVRCRVGEVLSSFCRLQFCGCFPV